ncbi:Protein of unknown function [Bacillus mycoides]|nr:Protein of unknown function [Bacillus mycoides]
MHKQPYDFHAYSASFGQ